MAEVIGDTIINVDGLTKYRKRVRSDLKTPTSGPMLSVYKKWAERYRSAMKLRFTKFSRGGGNWEQLKPATIAARRHGKGGGFKRGKRAHAKSKVTGGGKVSILWNLGQLIAVFSPTFLRVAGQLEKVIPFGIVVGFGGPGQFKDKNQKTTNKTVAEIAEIHHRGLGDNPKRTLLEDPSARLQKQMASDMEKGLKAELKRSTVKEPF